MKVKLNTYKKIKLENVCDILSGFAFDSKKFTDKQDDIPLIRIRDLKRGFTTTYYAGEYDKRYLVERGDFLIGMDGEFNIGEWKSDSALMNQRVCKLYCNADRLFYKFAYYFLPKVLKEIEGRTSFVTVPIINKKQFSEFLIPLPSLETQKQIAAILDKASQLIDLRKQQLAKMDLLIKSKFIAMFGDPVTNPMEWQAGSIRDVVSEVKYGTSKPSVANGEFVYLRMNNITYDGHLDLSNLKYIDISDNEVEKYIVKKGDVLFNRTNSKELVGKTCVFGEKIPMVIAGYIIRVRPNKKANSYYISAVLNSHYGKTTLFGMCKSIIGQANINAQELQDIKINIPPIELQNQFAAFVTTVEQQKAVMQASLEKLEINYKSLMQQYFG